MQRKGNEMESRLMPVDPYLIKDNVFKLIHSASGGIPRRINHICDACLMTGFARKKDTIDKELFKESGKIFGETVFTGEKL